MKVKILNRYGLFHKEDGTNPYSFNHADYQISIDKEKIVAHKDFLISLTEEENNRLTLIENKTSQLISQTGIIFSLLSLFVPILIDKVSDLAVLIKVLLLLLLVFAFLFYMLTIRNSLKNFKVTNFKYSKPSPNNVLKFQNKSLEEFYSEEVRDLLYALNQNTKTNNWKATNLLHSYNAFKTANTITGGLVIVFSIFLLFFSPKKEGVTIEKPVKIENMDSAINKIITVIDRKRDTIFVQQSDSVKSKK